VPGLPGNEDPDAPGGEEEAGDWREFEAIWENFLEQDEDGDHGDPEDIHDSGDEEEGHEEPAAAGAVGTVPKAHDDGACAAFAPLGEDEGEGCAAVVEAGALPRGELEDACEDEDGTTEDGTGAFHLWREEGDGVERPLREGGDEAEACPDDEVAGDEQGGGGKGAELESPLAIHHGEGEDHRRGGGDHHRDHHLRPHEEEREDGADGPRAHIGTGHGDAEALADAGLLHASGLENHVGPGECGDGRERHGDDDAIVTQGFLERRRGRCGGRCALGGSEANCYSGPW